MLHSASRGGHEAVSQLPFNLGADDVATGNDGWAPHDLAGESGCQAVILEVHQQ